MPWNSNDPDEQAFLAEFNDLPDRIIGLIAVSLVERRLKMAIKDRLTDTAKADLLNKLFDPNGNGMLSTFGAQIELGFALGLYDEVVMGDLKLCAKIRNKFAHNISDNDFNSPRIAPLITKLKMPSVYVAGSSAGNDHAEWDKIIRRTAVQDLSSGRGKFARSIEIIITILWKHLGYPNKLSAAPPSS